MFLKPSAEADADRRPRCESERRVRARAMAARDALGRGPDGRRARRRHARRCSPSRARRAAPICKRSPMKPGDTSPVARSLVRSRTGARSKSCPTPATSRCSRRRDRQPPDQRVRSSKSMKRCTLRASRAADARLDGSSRSHRGSPASRSRCQSCGKAIGSAPVPPPLGFQSGTLPSRRRAMSQRRVPSSSARALRADQLDPLGKPG